MQADNKTAKGRFDLRKWKAPIITDPEELRYTLTRMALESKVIQGFRLTDYSDVMVPEWDDAGSDKDKDTNIIDNSDTDTGANTDAGTDADAGTDTNTDNSTDADVQIPAFALLTSPLVIDFTDGTQLEIFMQSQSVVRLSANRIPPEAFDEERSALDRLFARCIGTSIVFAEVQVTEDYPEMATEFAAQLKGQSEFIDSILLCLDSGDALEIYSWGDSGEMDLLDENGELATVGMKEFREWA